MADKLKNNSQQDTGIKIPTPLEPCKDMKDGYCSPEFSEGCILDDEKKYGDNDND